MTTHKIIGSNANWEIDVFGWVCAFVDKAENNKLAKIACVGGARNLIIDDLAQAVIKWHSKGNRDNTEGVKAF